MQILQMQKSTIFIKAATVSTQYFEYVGTLYRKRILEQSQYYLLDKNHNLNLSIQIQVSSRSYKVVIINCNLIMQLQSQLNNSNNLY